ncbi:MAG: hypothetical protein M1834_008092 [Cirrosporium novae-zelandiae]|nr:MAG: hypothetical protein M1834_008092 [Cirrosporium novae-zelandiae]
MAPDASHKRLALAVHDFLSKSLTDGTLSPDDAESIEIAQSCIADVFHIDPNDKAAIQDALGGQSLMSIYNVYEKLKGKSTASTKGSSSAEEGRPSTPAVPTQKENGKASPEDLAKADGLKGQGNAAMQKKDYTTAIDFYTQALAISPSNPIYLSNRAAAYSASHNHSAAAEDAEMAVSADPKYTKAWSRLGLARFALGDAKGAMDAYKQGIDSEGNGGSEAMKRGYETAKKRFEEEQTSTSRGADNENDEVAPTPPLGAGMPDLSSLAGMFGGGGGGGGMPDLSSIMNNPMFSSMAQNLMQNPEMMSNLMNNPRLRDMANQFGQGGGAGQGGGMPDMSSLMNDPNIAEMARNLMGGQGGRGAGRGGSS